MFPHCVLKYMVSTAIVSFKIFIYFINQSQFHISSFLPNPTYLLPTQHHPLLLKCNTCHGESTKPCIESLGKIKPSPIHQERPPTSFSIRYFTATSTHPERNSCLLSFIGIYKFTYIIFSSHYLCKFLSISLKLFQIFYCVLSFFLTECIDKLFLNNSGLCFYV